MSLLLRVFFRVLLRVLIFTLADSVDNDYGVLTLWCEMLKEQKSIRDDPSSSFRTIIVEWERSPHALQCMSHIEKV